MGVYQGRGKCRPGQIGKLLRPRHANLVIRLGGLRRVAHQNGPNGCAGQPVRHEGFIALGAAFKVIDAKKASSPFNTCAISY